MHVDPQLTAANLFHEQNCFLWCRERYLDLQSGRPRLRQRQSDALQLSRLGKHDETQKLIRYTGFDHVFNADNEEDGQHRHNGERQYDGYDALCKCKLRFCNIFVVVQVGMLIGLKNFVEDRVLRTSIVEDKTATFSIDHNSQESHSLHGEGDHQ